MASGVGISGLQAAQRANLRHVASLRPGGSLEQAVKVGTLAAQRYSVSITHVWKVKGGGLRASQRVEVVGARGMVFIDPSSVNPRGQRPAVYGPYEHARGGTHAFFERTVEEAGKDIGATMGTVYLRGLR